MSLFPEYDLPIEATSTIRIQDVEGLHYIPDFITQLEHDSLIDAIIKEPWLNDLKRRVQHYGWKYDYKARSINYSMFLGDLPLWAQPIAERLFNLGLVNSKPDQLIVNEYLPGQGITAHVDCEPCFDSTIISLSLGSTCIMEIRNLENKNGKLDLLLEPRSLVVISGESRYKWTHGIPARLKDYRGHECIYRKTRISLTFRKVITSS